MEQCRIPLLPENGDVYTISVLAAASVPGPPPEMECDSDFAIGRNIPSPSNRYVEYEVLDKLGEGSFGNVGEKGGALMHRCWTFIVGLPMCDEESTRGARS